MIFLIDDFRFFRALTSSGYCKLYKEMHQCPIEAHSKSVQLLVSVCLRNYASRMLMFHVSMFMLQITIQNSMVGRITAKTALIRAGLVDPCQMLEISNLECDMYYEIYFQNVNSMQKV